MDSVGGGSRSRSYSVGGDGLLRSAGSAGSTSVARGRRISDGGKYGSARIGGSDGILREHKGASARLTDAEQRHVVSRSQVVPIIHFSQCPPDAPSIIDEPEIVQV